MYVTQTLHYTVLHCIPLTILHITLHHIALHANDRAMKKFFFSHNIHNQKGQEQNMMTYS